MLTLDDNKYAELLFELYEQMDIPTRVHVVVAYANLIPILTGFYEHAEKAGRVFTVEHFIRETSSELESHTDEINSRRFAWFLFAAMLARLEKLSRHNEFIKEIGARIWCMLIVELPKQKVLLPENVVWKPEEKLWFDLSHTDNMLIQLGINNQIPPVFAQTETVKNFTKSLGLSYFPSRYRVGIVP